MTFESFPVVHLERGAFPEYPTADTEDVLTRLARKYESVVLVDTGGIKYNNADLEFYQKAARKRALWVDAGSRYSTDAMDLFVAGAERVTMRWNTLHAVEELADAAALAQPGGLFLGLEFPRKTFLKNAKDARSAADVVRLADGLGIGVVYITDTDDPFFVRDLPLSQVERYHQGAKPMADLQSWGFAGELVGPVNIEPEGEKRDG